MPVLRRLACRHRWLAALVVMLALAMRLLVPAGYMPVVADGSIVVGICSGTGPAQMTIALPGTPHDQSAPHDGKADQPCAFAGAAMPSLAAADPLLLALVIAFVMAAGLAPVVRRPATDPAHLRPPLRGPPRPA